MNTKRHKKAIRTRVFAFGSEGIAIGLPSRYAPLRGTGRGIIDLVRSGGNGKLLKPGLKEQITRLKPLWNGPAFENVAVGAVFIPPNSQPKTVWLLANHADLITQTAGLDSGPPWRLREIIHEPQGTSDEIDQCISDDDVQFGQTVV